MTDRFRPSGVPRAASLAMLLALWSHVDAAVVAMRQPEWIPAWHWAAMACTDVLVVVVMLVRPAWFMLRHFRLPGVFVVSTGVLILVPLPDAVRRYGVLVPHATVLAIALGLAVASLTMLALTDRPPTRSRTPESKLESLVPWVILFGSVLLLPIWIRAIGAIPLLELLRGGSNPILAAQARDRALDSLSNGVLRNAVGSVRNLYLMFATGYLVSKMATIPRREWRRITGWRAVGAGAVLVAVVYALLTTERAILGELVIVTVVAFLVTKRRPLGVKHIALVALVGISFPVVFALLVGAGGISDALAGLKRRILFLPTDVMMHYFIAFPQQHEFLQGAGVPKLGRLTAGGTFDLSAFIYDQYYKVDSSVSGIANGSFLGVGWANWGLVGVVMACAATGVALVVTERLIVKLGRSCAAALTGLAVVQTALLTSSDISRSLLGFLPGFLDLVVVLFIARAVDRRFSVRAAVLPPAVAPWTGHRSAPRDSVGSTSS